ncbi:MAG: hypothetical protein KBS56_04770 [Clostridiales bacterium]|nr:hypothetical protein [Candidatus Crickella equi]
MVKFTAPEDRVVLEPNRVIDAEKKILEELIIDPGYSYMMMTESLGISKKTVL